MSSSFSKGGADVMLVDDGVEISSDDPHVRISTSSVVAGARCDNRVDMFTMGRSYSDYNHEAFQISSAHGDYILMSRASGLGEVRNVVVQAGERNSGQFVARNDGTVSASKVEFDDGALKCSRILLGKCELSSTTSSAAGALPDRASWSLKFPSYAPSEPSLMSVDSSGAVSWLPCGVQKSPPTRLLSASGVGERGEEKKSAPVFRSRVVEQDDETVVEAVTKRVRVQDPVTLIVDRLQSEDASRYGADDVFVLNEETDEGSVLHNANVRLTNSEFRNGITTLSRKNGSVVIQRAALGTDWACSFDCSFGRHSSSSLTLSVYDRTFEIELVASPRNEFHVISKFLGETIHKATMQKTSCDDENEFVAKHISIAFDWKNSRRFSVDVNRTETATRRIPIPSTFCESASSMKPAVFFASGDGDVKLSNVCLKRNSKGETAGSVHLFGGVEVDAEANLHGHVTVKDALSVEGKTNLSDVSVSGRLSLSSSANPSYVSLKESADCSESYTLTLPASLPPHDDDAFLVSDRFGRLKWSTTSSSIDLSGAMPPPPARVDADALPPAVVVVENNTDTKRISDEIRSLNEKLNSTMTMVESLRQKMDKIETMLEKLPSFS